MKKAILFLVAFYPMVMVGQVTSNFEIRNGQAYYCKVFELPGQSRDSVITQLRAMLPLVPHVSNVHLDELGFTGTISQMKINYSGFYLMLMNSMFANLVVQVKDGKYRIVIKDIYFVDNAVENDELTDFTAYVAKNGYITKRPVEDFKDRTNLYSLLAQMDQYFTSVFTISNPTLNDDW